MIFFNARVGITRTTEKTEMERQVKTSIESITPSIAKAYLIHANPKNRNISNAAVENYADAMSSGLWHMNGEAIVFDSTGMLMNGHHRLPAVIKSGATVEFLVVRGVLPDTFTTFDGGKGRTPGDVFQMANCKRANLMASVSGSVWRYERAINQKGGCGSWNTYLKPTRAELLQRYEEAPHLFDEAGRLAKLAHHNGIKINPSILATLYFIAMNDGVNLDHVKCFAQQVATGERLVQGDPALTLRDFAIRNLGNDKRSNLTAGINYVRNACAIAWNAYANKKKLRLIRVIDSNKVIAIDTVAAGRPF